MDEFKCRAIEALQDIPEDDSELYVLSSDISNILEGSIPLDLSHAGGEFNQLLEEDLCSEQLCVRSFLFACSFIFNVRQALNRSLYI